MSIGMDLLSGGGNIEPELGVLPCIEVVKTESEEVVQSPPRKAPSGTTLESIELKSEALLNVKSNDESHESPIGIEVSNSEERLEGKKKSHLCNSCGEAFQDEYFFEAHLIECRKAAKPVTCSTAHCDGRQCQCFHCDQCGRSFGSKNDLRRHRRTHTGERPYECVECGKSFALNGNLQKHMRIHSGEKQHKCDLCSAAFQRKSNLKRHKSSFHCDRVPNPKSVGDTKNPAAEKLGQNSAKCHERDDTLLSDMGMESDEEYRAKEQTRLGKTESDEETKQFGNEMLEHSSGLHDGKVGEVSHDVGHSSHDSHSKDKPCQCVHCEVCGKSFGCKTDLKRHMMIHTGEKPYKCVECGKSFSQRGNLKMHMSTHTGEKPYKCDLCFKGFNRTNNLSRHKQTCQGIDDKPFRCDICPAAFTRTSNLNRHRKKFHGDEIASQEADVDPESDTAEEGEMKPDVSDSSCFFEPLIETSRDQVGDVDRKPIVCGVCYLIFEDEDDLVQHMEAQHENAVSKDVFDKINSTSSEKKAFQCDQCEKTFSRKQGLERHKLVHTGEKPYQCSFCDKSFRWNGDLLRHVRTHTGEKPYKCDICSETFTRATNLAHHKRRIHRDQFAVPNLQSETGEQIMKEHEGKPHVCLKCYLIFESGDALREHTSFCNAEELKSPPFVGSLVMGHRDESLCPSQIETEQLVCETGPFAFKEESAMLEYNLSPHKSYGILTDEVPQFAVKIEPGVDELINDEKMDEREKQFWEEDTLLTSVGEEKRHKCDLCDKSYTRKSGLESHMLVHSQQKPFQCDQCDKSFRYKQDLKRHKLLHTGEKPHQCNQCGKSFAQKSYLTVHERIHTGEKPFKCQKCDKKFSRAGQLMTHIWAHEKQVKT